MTIVNPEHLLDQAEPLIGSASVGAPRQVDLRRAISSAYYASFHAVLIALADQFVGSTRRATAEYALAYRRVDHAGMRRLCNEIKQDPIPVRLSGYFLSLTVSADLQAFAATVVELQEKRHDADYNPLISFKASDARAIVTAARTSVLLLDRISAAERLTFLCLLAFQPR